MREAPKISKEALQEIEFEANRAVWKNLTIEVSYPSKEELEEHPEIREEEQAIRENIHNIKEEAKEVEETIRNDLKR